MPRKFKDVDGRDKPGHDDNVANAPRNDEEVSDYAASARLAGAAGACDGAVAAGLGRGLSCCFDHEM
jgi:hypothetical protein